MASKRKAISAAVVPFHHVLVAVLNYDDNCPLGANSEIPPDHTVCSTLELARQALANHQGTGSVEAWGVDSDYTMKLWRKTSNGRRCPLKHLEQVDTSYYWPGRSFDPKIATIYKDEP